MFFHEYNKTTSAHDLNVHTFRFRKIAFLITALFNSTYSFAEEYFELDALELQDGVSSVDISRFIGQGQQVPGVYRVDIYLNNILIETRDVNFLIVDNKLEPEFTVKDLALLGVRVSAYPVLSQKSPDEKISKLQEFLPGAFSVFDFNQQRLDISIPQAGLESKARDTVDPLLWDQGITAFMLNYSMSGADTYSKTGGNNSRTAFVNLRSGINWHAWRLRNYSTWTEQSSKKWNTLGTQLERDIHSLRSQMSLGDVWTPGQIFDSVQLRGLKLASDDTMLADSQRGYAPVIRGIAKSNAQVTVRQNGHIVYQAYVPPGAFEISDLYPTSSSGDLQLTITEADGTEYESVYPFAAVPIMVREGQIKYAVTAGKYRSTTEGGETPEVVESTLIYGLPFSSTVYSGTQQSSNYQSLLIGIGHSLGDWGSVSFDGTYARSRLPSGQRSQGQSYRFQYSKSILSTGTNFTLAGYRYSTSGFYDLREINEFVLDDAGKVNRNNNRRSRANISVSQTIGSLGSVYVNAYQQEYWGDRGHDRSISAGFGTNINGIGYNLNYAYSQGQSGRGHDQQIALSIQIPLSKWLPNSWATINTSARKDGSNSQQVGISGSALENNNLLYSAQQSFANRATGESGTLNSSYRGSKGNLNVGYNYSRMQHQLNYGAEGAVVIHPYGMTLARPIGDTAVLIKAKGAQGINVYNQSEIATDSWGYAVVPYASAYRKNNIALDTASMPHNVDVDQHSRLVIPTRGALGLAEFTTRIGSRVVMNLSWNGKPVPFGAMASLKKNKGEVDHNGIVGPDGQVYFSGMPAKGTIFVKWGYDNKHQCETVYTLPENKLDDVLQSFNAICK
ncbi:fimbrial biogenesis outer membrane usher protein [Pantoea sp. Taur]|nr:fimbrial biogenesis outer membrane usher protein [Pantoea sp. Taur]